jgi:hypothetical protein
MTVIVSLDSSREGCRIVGVEGQSAVIAKVRIVRPIRRRKLGSHNGPFSY